MSLDALEVLEVGEGARRPELVVHIDVAAERVDLVENRGQFLVFGGDQLDRLVGDVRVARDDGDGSPTQPHLAVGQDWLVVEGRPVIGVRDYLSHVVDGDDVAHAGDLLRRARVYGLDAAVRYRRAAEDLRMQHPRYAHGVGVLGAAGDLVARFHARKRPPDLAAGFCGAFVCCRCHACSLRPSRLVDS